MTPSKEHPLKLSNQLVALVLGTLLSLVGLVVSLAVFAQWSDGAIVGMVTGFATIATGVIVAVRNQQKTQETLANQDEKLETIERQTNGLSTTEKEELAERGAAVVIMELKRQGVIR